MRLPKELTTVTPLSKTLASIVFVTLPIIAFLFGMIYQRMLGDDKVNIPPSWQKTCTLEAKICPNGSTVGRSGPNCEFTPCPSKITEVEEGGFCGGIAGVQCPNGYYCDYGGKNYPDASGTCIKEPDQPKDNKYVNENFGFSFNLNQGEWVVVCPNLNEFNDNIAVWITTDPREAKNQGSACAREESGKELFTSRKANNLNSIEDYFTTLSRDYNIEKEEITLLGVRGYKVTGTRNSSDPAPLPEKIKNLVFFNNGILYVIPSTLWSRNFSFL